MNANNAEQSRSLSDDILCCDDTHSDDFKLSTSSNLDQFTTASDTQVCGGGQGRRGLVHSVSIIVEPAIMDDCDFDSDLQISPAVPSERRKTIAGPIVLLEDFYFGECHTLTPHPLTHKSLQTNPKRPRSTTTLYSPYS